MAPHPKTVRMLSILVYSFAAFIIGAGAIWAHVHGAASISVNHNLINKTVIMAVCSTLFGCFILEVLVSRKAHSMDKDYLGLGTILCVAFLLRVAVALFMPVAQESDFSVYYNMGIKFANGDITGARAIMEEFGLYSLSGLVVLNGILAYITGKSMLGFIIGQAVVSVVSIAFIYKIGEKIHFWAATIAASLFSIYPASIFYITITTNQHFATMFFLISVYVIMSVDYTSSTRKPEIAKCFVAGLLLALSYYAHPSTLPLIAALFVWSLYLCIKNPNSIKHILTMCIFILASYKLALVGGDSALIGMGITGRSSENGSMLGKFVVGLNYETTGQTASPYRGYINEMDLLNHIPKDEVEGYMKRKIIERITDPRVFELFVKKDKVMWHAPDNVFIWTARASNLATKNAGNKPDGIDNRRQLVLNEAAKKADYYFLLLVYIACSIGLVALAIGNGWNVVNNQYLVLLTLFLDAWISVFIFIEVQPRYRYEMMGIIFILSSIGVIALFDMCKKYFFYSINAGLFKKLIHGSACSHL